MKRSHLTGIFTAGAITLAALAAMTHEAAGQDMFGGPVTPPIPQLSPEIREILAGADFTSIVKSRFNSLGHPASFDMVLKLDGINCKAAKKLLETNILPMMGGNPRQMNDLKNAAATLFGTGHLVHTVSLDIDNAAQDSLGGVDGQAIEELKRTWPAHMPRKIEAQLILTCAP